MKIEFTPAELTTALEHYLNHVRFKDIIEIKTLTLNKGTTDSVTVTVQPMQISEDHHDWKGPGAVGT
jgi:hypothetical protein